MPKRMHKNCLSDSATAEIAILCSSPSSHEFEIFPRLSFCVGFSTRKTHLL
jgi:hypothetical protein